MVFRKVVELVLLIIGGIVVLKALLFSHLFASLCVVALAVYGHLPPAQANLVARGELALTKKAFTSFHT